MKDYVPSLVDYIHHMQLKLKEEVQKISIQSFANANSQQKNEWHKSNLKKGKNKKKET